METKEMKKRLNEEDRMVYAESIYKLYPRKEGKWTGLKRIASQLNTLEDFLLIKKATETYAERIKRNETPREYIMMFSTFANKRWEDFIDGDPAETPSLPEAYERLLSPLGLQYKFRPHASRLLHVWKTEDQFLNFLIHLKNYYSRKNDNIDVNNASEDFRKFVSICISKDLGL